MTSKMTNETTKKMMKIHRKKRNNFFRKIFNKFFLAESFFWLFLSRFSVVKKIIFNSEAGRIFFEKKLLFSKKKSVVIRNALSTTSFYPLMDKMDKMDKIFSQNVVINRVIGVFGRIVEGKGHAIFLDAFSLVKRQHPKLSALIVGPGCPKLIRALKEKAMALKISEDIKWLDAQTDMLSCYHAIDIFCSPSFAEGTSNVILEAMACGVPCVVTDVGDSRYLVGKNNIVVKPASSESLAEGLISMLTQLSSSSTVETLRDSNHTRVHTLFSPEVIFTQTEAVLTTLFFKEGRHS